MRPTEQLLDENQIEYPIVSTPETRAQCVAVLHSVSQDDAVLFAVLKLKYIDKA